MTGTHVTEILPAYALGALDGAELLEVARHLPGCPACRGELAEWYRTADALSTAMPLNEPPADLRARVIESASRASRSAAASSTRPAETPNTPAPSGWLDGLREWLSPRRGLGFAVLLLVVLMAAGNVLLLRQVSNLRATAVHPSEMRLIRLKGTDAAPLASGYMIAFPGERDGSLTVDDVPALDAYHQYQVWLIDDGKRTSGGVFSVNDQGYGVLLITAEYPLDSYDGFGITIEPTGGSPGPTGKKVLGTDT